MTVEMIVLGTLIIAAGVFGIFRVLMEADKDHGMDPEYKEWTMLIIGSLIMSVVWGDITMRQPAAIKAAWLILCIYYLGCSLMDAMTCQVYDVMQFMGLGSAVCTILWAEPPAAVGVSVLVFTILQSLVFRHLYGEADCMAFLIGALILGALGYEIEMYFLHMILAYLLLTGMQICRGNVGGKGRLKHPVPFYPYITVGLCVILLFGEQITR